MGRNDLGAVLRELREGVEPETVGFAVQGRRRTRGLRREELGELAGVSADYIRRLEQGRARPSLAVVNAVARALRLAPAQYEWLCALAGYAAADGHVPTELTPGAGRLLERVGGAAVCVCDAGWNVVGWNAAWANLRCGEPTGHRWDGNVVWRTFGDAPSRVSRTTADAARFDSMLVSRLRTASLRYPADASLAALVDELRTASGRFDRLWRTTGNTVAQADSAVLGHPDLGDIALDCDLLAVPHGDLVAMVFTARPGSADADRLGEIVDGSRTVGRIGPG
ncbi:helix-turn-helix domain-containing protein [Nocardia australiensis]|uniref:helix-turn-helix domain-containing protein n=1 Tax=Nocardia australiensis TaxID=2887191 RepID=UPI001D1468EA|nr:helix-turn-helix domain-containing protein [Nocardia australiensis]